MKAVASAGRKRIPVILDTDIGGDIDDTWALAMMLRCPELDVRMVVTDTDDTEYRARIAAKLLEVAGRADVPVAVGLRQNETRGRQWRWVEDYDLGRYPGTVFQDGVGALCEAVLAAPEPVRLVCIGPVPNIAAALDRAPGIAGKAHFVGMHGCVRRDPRREEAGVVAEYNVKRDPAACGRTLGAPWLSATLTPLDTCARARLHGERYRRVRDAAPPLTRAVIENYRIWATGTSRDPDRESSILFDTVAVYLAFSREHLAMQRMGLRVTDEGFTVPDPNGPPIDVALDWTDLNAFLDFLTGRLTGA